jgi:hypothetical protein
MGLCLVGERLTETTHSPVLLPEQPSLLHPADP